MRSPCASRRPLWRSAAKPCPRAGCAAPGATAARMTGGALLDLEERGHRLERQLLQPYFAQPQPLLHGPGLADPFRRVDLVDDDESPSGHKGEKMLERHLGRLIEVEV